ncbi:helix-turn-helix domain-containing protein [Sporosarcina luteola]|uniref:helix-turn-helix transcriptional regulator n=1 Tax=Sporosarcina luteola TaxID=582850 RepID=UPI00203BEB45|nr:helix-turn-helix domain-containing protein [Sporosarcina luteola]MCM3637727.1 helix-turn-helix domain-containing protein [Sporosarcina luteola]
MHIQLFIKRREARMKQVDVAKILNINNATYSLKENGKADFTLREAIKLAAIFGCTLNDLFWDQEV